MRTLFRCCFLACAVLGAPGSATAQNPSSYPDRPIRLLVAFVAGRRDRHAGAADFRTT